MQIRWKGNQRVSVQMDYRNQQYYGGTEEIRGWMYDYSSKRKLKLSGATGALVNPENQILLIHSLTQKILV